MNPKTTYWLFGTLVALLVVASISLLTGTKPGDEGVLLSRLRSADVKAKDVTRITIDRKLPTEAKYVFVRTGGDRWQLEEPYIAKVDGRQVERVVSDLLDAKKVTKGADLSNNPSSFGLDQPSLRVTITAGDRVTTVNFGRVTPGSANNAFVYVTTSEEPNRPAALKRSDLGGLLRDDPDADTAGTLVRGITDFRSKDMLLENTFTPADVVRSVKIKGEKTEIALNKSSTGAWQYEKPTGFGDADVEGDVAGIGGDTAPTGVKPLLTALGAIKAGSNDDFIENVTDFKQYGLDPAAPAGPRVEVVRNNPSGDDAAPITETLTIGKKEEKGDRVFVRPGNEAVVVKVPESQIEPLRKLLDRPGALRDRNLLSIVASGVDGADIQVGADAPIELRKAGTPQQWKLFGPGDAAVTANAQAVSGMVNDLAARRLVKEFPDAAATDATLGFDHPTATVTLWVNGVLPQEEKKDDKKDEKKDEAKAKDDSKDKAKDQPKDEAKDKAKDQPKDKAKDQPKEEGKDKAKDQPKGEAKDQGKDQPKAEAKDDKKPESKEMKPKMKEPTVKLIFGKRDKDLLYVRRVVGNAKTDLAVPESLLAKLTRGRLDYLDSTLPSFVADKATKLTFTRGGETFVIEKQQKDDKSPTTWVIQQPTQLAGRNADVSKVIRLLDDLSSLHAERLWAEKATDREMERFGLRPARISATVSLKDDKDKERTYYFGAETDDKSQVYAKQSERDLVFSVRKGIIDDLMQAELSDPTVFRLDLAKVTGMKLTGWKDVVGQETTLDLERKGTNNWTAKSPPGYKLSASQAESFLGLLSSVRAEKFVSYKDGPKPEQKLTPATGALQIELTIDGEKEPVTLTLGAETEGKYYFAQSSKLPGDVFLLPKDLFEKFKAKPGIFAAE